MHYRQQFHLRYVVIDIATFHAMVVVPGAWPPCQKLATKFVRQDGVTCRPRQSLDIRDHLLGLVTSRHR